MKFAFSSSCFPRSDLQSLACKARELAYSGVELTEVPADPAASAAIFQNAGIDIACLNSDIAMTGRKTLDAHRADDTKALIDSAAALKCRHVRILDPVVHPHQKRSLTAAALAEWLRPLADYACGRGVTLLVENLSSCHNARELWLVLENADAPALAVCWNLFHATKGGEAPAISVPILNSRIQYARVGDASTAAFCKLGEGDLAIMDFVQRLRGIGYHGWMSVECDPSDTSQPDEYLADALAKLRQWESMPVPAKTAAEKKSPPATVAAVKK